MSRISFLRSLLFCASILAGLALWSVPETGTATQALRGSCNDAAGASICTEYYDFTPGYVQDLCEMGGRPYNRGACSRANLVGTCQLAGNITFYYSTGGTPYTKASARTHCVADGEARFQTP